MAAQSVTGWLAALESNDTQRYNLVQALRQVALEAGPAITEEIKYGGILFAARQGFCGIFSYAGHVSLEFSDGAKLRDPHQALEGQGKLRRHLKFMSIADIESRHTRDYVANAYVIAMAL